MLVTKIDHDTKTVTIGDYEMLDGNGAPDTAFPPSFELSDGQVLRTGAGFTARMGDDGVLYDVAPIDADEYEG